GGQPGVEAMLREQAKDAVGDVIAGNVHDRNNDGGLGQARLLEVEGLRVVDLEIGDARRVFAHCAGVEARTATTKAVPVTSRISVITPAYQRFATREMTDWRLECKPALCPTLTQRATAQLQDAMKRRRA